LGHCQRLEERQESKEVVLKAINEKSISKNTNYLHHCSDFIVVVYGIIQHWISHLRFNI
jgi:hypothetical protein